MATIQCQSDLPCLRRFHSIMTKSLFTCHSRFIWSSLRLRTLCILLFFRKTWCDCGKCFFGTKCQFSTKGFGLSLDAILGYHIYPRLAITRQSILVKVSIAVSTLMLVVGLINGIFCTLTFQTKLPRQVGCGLYLLASSIASILTIIVFNLKL
jgi:hypothetical protein